MTLEQIGVEATIQGLSSFRRGIGQMEGDVRGFGRTTDGLLPGLNSMGDSLLKIGGIAAGAVVAGLAAAAGGMIAFAGSGIKSAIEMQDKMGDIASVMNTTKEAIEPLSDLIDKLGLDPSLQVTAVEAADAIELLARNGLTMTEIIDGAAHATVLLANATGADFANAANIATDAMAIFGVEAEDMLNTVSGIVSVTTNSKFTIDDYSLALRNGGAAAALMNVSLEDFNTVVAASAEEMGSGMRAGTGFRNFITRLTPSTEGATAAMRDLGLVTSAGTNMFFNANGELKDMAEVSEILENALFGTSVAITEVGGRTAAQNEELSRLQGIYARTLTSINDYELGIKGAGLSEEARAEKLADLNLQLSNTAAAMGPLNAIQGEFVETTKELTDAERSAALELIFGQDALGTAIALANEGEVVYTDLATAMRDTGLSQEQLSEAMKDGSITSFELLAAQMAAADAAAMAEERMSDVAGIMEVIGGIIETVQKQIGDEFLPILQDLGLKFMGIVENVGPQVVAFFADIAGGISAFMQLFQATGDLEGSIFTGLFAAGIPPEIINQIREFVDSIHDVIDTVTEFVTQHAEAFKGAIAGIGAVLGASVIVSVLTTIAGVIATILSPIGLLVIGVAALGAAWQSNFGNIQGITFGIIGTIQELIAVFQEGGLLGVMMTLTESWGLNWELIQAVIMTAWETITSVIDSAIAVIQPAFQTFIDSVSGGFSRFDTLIPAFAQLWEAVKPIITVALAAIGAAILAIVGVVVGVVNGVAAAIGPLIDTFRIVLHNVIEIFSGIADFLTNFVQLVIGLFQGNSEAVEAAWQNMGTAIKQIVTGLVEGVVGLIVGLGVSLAALVEGIVEGIVDFFTNLYDELVGNSIIVDLVEDILELFFNLATDLIVSVTNMVDDLIDLIVTFAGEMIGKFVNMVNDIVGIFNNTDWGALGQAIIDGLINAIRNGGAAVIGAITDLANQAVNAAKEALGIDSPSKVFAEIGVNLAQGLIAGISSMEGTVQETIKALFDVGGALGGIGSGFANQLKNDVFPQLKAAVDSRQGFLDAAAKKFVGDFGGLLGITDSEELLKGQNLVNAYFMAIQTGNQQMKQDIESIWQTQNNLNQATQEYEDAQASILALQKAQADLAFLQQQQELLDLITEHGLNASEILGGLELGLGADTQGLVEAMTRAIQAIIEQANEQLEIQSPSGIFKEIGKFITSGLAEGISQTATNPAHAMESMLAQMTPGVSSQAAMPSVINQPSTTTITKTATVDMTGAQISNDMDLQRIGDVLLQRVAESI